MRSSVKYRWCSTVADRSWAPADDTPMQPLTTRARKQAGTFRLFAKTAPPIDREYRKLRGLNILPSVLQVCATL